jgi:hypothetical protein
MLRRTVLAAALTAVAATSVVPSAAAPKGGPPVLRACTGDPADVRRATPDRRGAAGARARRPAADEAARHRGVRPRLRPHDGELARARLPYGRDAGRHRDRAELPGQTVPPVGKQVASRGWRVAEGAADSIAYAQHYERRCRPTGLNVVYGVSMGGNTSGLVVAARPQGPDGKPLFDHWVDVEGAVNITQTYLGARTLAPLNEFAANAQADVEEAFGGPLERVPDVYADRTVVNRTDDIAAAGLRGVTIVHGVADGLVTHDESRQLQALLRARGVPVDVWSAVTRSADAESGTTLDGYAPSGQTSPFAGHAAETSLTHDVGKAGFAALDRLYSDAPFTCGEKVFDGLTGVEQGTTTGC